MTEPLLPPGARIGAIPSSHAWDPARLAAGIAMVEAHGYEVVMPPVALTPHRSFAGTWEQRMEATSWALHHPDLDAAWAIRGGSGVLQLLDALDVEGVGRRPVLGFSDLTPLLHELHLDAIGPAIHGPVLHSLAGTDARDVAAVFDLLAGRPVAPIAGSTWVPGTATGELVGGNLAMIAACAGTFARFSAPGRILLLEEVGEPVYRIERMLWQLQYSGVLTPELAGVAVGQLTGCGTPAGQPADLREVLLEWLEPLGIPVLGDLPIGHGTRNHPVILGARATIADGHLTQGSWRHA